MTDDSASVCSANTRAEYLALIRENIEYDYFEDKKAVNEIEYVLTALKKNTSDVRNIRAYLMTALYNAPSTMDIYYQAWVNYNMSHPKS